MDRYITGKTIKSFRENLGMTQFELAEKLMVSDKTVSKWETGRGLPDISMLEPLAQALKVSLAELFSGEDIVNVNRGANMQKMCMYVCPVCGNIITSTGEACISCCGIELPPLEAEQFDDDHKINLEQVEDEWYVTLDHEMTKQHYISFLAFATGEKIEIVKLYPEGNAQARFKRRGHGMLYAYCNRHGLMRTRI